MHPQLRAVQEDFEAAQARLHALEERVPASLWVRRPDPTRWSLAECVAHLNLTSEAYLPRLREALQRARRPAGGPPPRYRRDPVGWFFWRTAGPPVRYRVRTTAPFMPAAAASAAELIAEFDRLQAAQLGCVAAADELDLGRAWITSPFDPRVRYNAYACLTILPRHQHRHLWQAEQVLGSLATSQ